LSFLAEQMMSVNNKKQAETTGFLQLFVWRINLKSLSIFLQYVQ
jgi:hypothetical protein